MNTRHVEDYLKRLKEHERFLEKKLREKEESKTHYLKAELLALRWMISYTEDTIQEAAEHQYKWLQENEVR